MYTLALEAGTTMRLIRFAVLALFVVAVCHPEVLAGNFNVAGNVFVNTLMIQTSNGKGTGFTIDVGGRQYLITARHMISGMGSEGTIEIGKFANANRVVFESYTMKIFPCAGSIDIAVLIPPKRLTVGETMEPAGSASFIVGQDAYFVGFPFGMYSNAKFNSGSSRPFGFVKRGLVSGVQYQSADDGDLIVLDGYNVFGFSGSPVTYWEPPNGTTPARSYVIGRLDLKI
jgi:hypothetical protein